MPKASPRADYPLPRRGLHRIEAAVYVGVSTTKFDEMVENRTMPEPIHIGSRLVWDIRKLDDAFDALSFDEIDTWADRG
ncbi:MAG TPA: hypothetical protein VHB74_02470 [Devosia sp.]|nr:hypothetical protein [Devosia sp.]